MRRGFKEQQVVADEAAVDAALGRLADELVESADNLDRLALVGIHTRSSTESAPASAN